MISNVHIFSSFYICTSAVSLFLASICPSIYGAAIERMFTSRCLCAIIRQCTINLSLYRCHPLHLFCLIEVCSLSTSSQFFLYLQRGSNSFPAMKRTFLLSYKRKFAIPRKDNQVTCLEVICCRIKQRNVLKSCFAACEKVRWQVKESGDEDKDLQKWRIRNFR